jgi:hypothetical protein
MNRLAFLILLVPWPLMAAETSIDAPATIEPHKPIVVKAVTDAAVCLWRLEKPAEYISLDGGKVLHVWAPPGSHEIELTAISVDWDAKVISAQQQRATITVTGAQPPPIPPLPPPGPPTPPDPPQPPAPGQLTGPAYIVVLAEHDKLTTEQAGTLNKLRAWSDSNPAIARLYQLNPAAAGSDARIAAYLALVPASGQLPWCIITRARTDQAGAAVLWSGALPGAEEIIKRVQEVVK